MRRNDFMRRGGSEMGNNLRGKNPFRRCCPLMAKTIGVVARAKGMSEISRKTNRSREALYRSFDGNTKAEFVEIVRVLDVLGVRLVAQAKAA
jgi:DNA-binding phage protein